MKFRPGFTLTEILVVIVIISLLAGLLLPALAAARNRSKETVCISQMRQLAMSFISYMDEHEGPPRSEGLDAIAADRGVPPILKCPADRHSGFATAHLLCAGVRISSRSSYYTPFSRPDLRWTQLLALDPNPGIIACRSHGSAVKFANESSPIFCSRAAYMYSGKVVRARRDGSVKVVPYELEMGHTGQLTFSMWRLFTDVPEPSAAP